MTIQQFPFEVDPGLRDSAQRPYGEFPHDFFTTEVTADQRIIHIGSSHLEFEGSKLGAGNHLKELLVILHEAGDTPLSTKDISDKGFAHETAEKNRGAQISRYMNMVAKLLNNENAEPGLIVREVKDRRLRKLYQLDPRIVFMRDTEEDAIPGFYDVLSPSEKMAYVYVQSCDVERSIAENLAAESRNVCALLTETLEDKDSAGFKNDKDYITERVANVYVCYQVLERYTQDPRTLEPCRTELESVCSAFVLLHRDEFRAEIDKLGPLPPETKEKYMTVLIKELFTRLETHFERMNDPKRFSSRSVSAGLDS